MADDLNASIKITAFDAFTKPVEAMKRSLTSFGASAAALKSVNFTGISNSATRVGAAMNNVRGSVMGVRTALAAMFVSGAGVALFKKQLLDPAEGYEKFTAQLTAIQGSAAKAGESMKWVRQFAIDTPFDLAESTRAFESLRVKGIEPTQGVMKAIGEAATGMGKPIEQATDAINQALKGRMMGLGDFGITGHDAGKELQFAYVDAAGKKRVRTADKHNKQMVADTLAAIFNDKFKGAMGLFDATYGGMVENLGDSWAEFRLSIMEAGLFEYIKTNMGELLGWVRKVTASGELQQWAKNISDGFIAVFEFIKTNGPRVVDWITSIATAVNSVVDVFGGWGTILQGFVALKVVGVGKALFGLNKEVLGLGFEFVKTGGAILETLHPAFGLQIKSISDLRTALQLLTASGWAALTPLGKIAAIGMAAAAGWKIGSFINEKFIEPRWSPNNPEQVQEVYKGASGMATSSSVKGPAWAPQTNLPSWAAGVVPKAAKPALVPRPSAFRSRDDGRMRGDMTIRILSNVPAAVSNVMGQNMDINTIYNGATP